MKKGGIKHELATPCECFPLSETLRFYEMRLLIFQMRTIRCRVCIVCVYLKMMHLSAFLSCFGSNYPI